MPPFSFLGVFITKDIPPLTFKLNVKDKYALTDIQQLCSIINWLKPFLPVPEWEMRHLFSLLKGPMCPLEKVALLREAKLFYQKYLQHPSCSAINQNSISWCWFFGCQKGSLGALGQEGLLMWVHQVLSNLHKFTFKSDQTFQPRVKMQMLTQRTYGRERIK